MSDKIDFVITWVDGSDKTWQLQKEKYQNTNNIISENTKSQYRDWDTLRFWFRSIEENAPWVNKIYFVTCGQKPQWLNENNKKLVLINHTDYIPNEYLPTFSSHVIELFFHKIKGLSEKFVYFNDDMILNAPVKESDFFRDGMPCDCAILETLSPNMPEDPFVHYLANDISVINHNFKKRKVLNKNFYKFFNLKYGKGFLKNIFNSFTSGFSAFHNFHMPQAYLKLTYKDLWEKETSILKNTAEHRFRNEKDVNQYVFKYWQLAQGKFFPISPRGWAFYSIGENNDGLYKDITYKKHKLICINDSLKNLNFKKENDDLVRCLEKRYPNRSLFEKD